MIANKEIANILRRKGNADCILMAETLENKEIGISHLHLRNLSLNDHDVADIAAVLKQVDGTNQIISLSMSYNREVGDIGITHLVKSLPASLTEIGLVDCEIGDLGGVKLLNWITKSKNIQMICLEQNNFSPNLKREFDRFKSEKPHVLLHY